MALLFILGAALAVCLSVPVRRRRAARGSGTFLWLLAGIAVWCLTAAGHWLSASLDAKLAWSRVQYLGIASVPPLWCTFACEYAGSTRLRRRSVRAALWAIPLLTVLAAFTNGWHRALWPSVTLTPGGAAVYAHGWWFWIAAAYSYVLVLGGTLGLVRTLRGSTALYQGQYVVLLAAALLPLAGNVVYLAGWLPFPGVDLTPLMFLASAGLLTSGLYRNRLFDLVPVARDQLVESLSDGVLVIDSSRRVLDMNRAAIELAPPGTARDAAIGRPIEALLPFLDGTPLTTDVSGALHFVAPAGPRHVDVRVTPVHARDGRQMGWAVLLRDVSEQRRAATEREALERRVQEQQKHESLSVLAGGLAHDFNNLLAGILGNADLLALKLPPSSEMGSSVGEIILGAQRAADLVSKMLAYAGERHGATVSVDLDRLIREMLDLLQTSVARHCSLHYRGQAVDIFADPVQIRQVVMNLILNAAEAVEEDGGAIQVQVGTEHLAAWQLTEMRFGDDAPPGPYAFLEVTDNGSGMDAPTIDRIFTPFYSTKPMRHGLGLAAVQGIVRGHRGALHLDSRPGQGTRVTVWFPLAPRAPRQTRADSPASPSLIS